LCELEGRLSCKNRRRLGPTLFDLALSATLLASSTRGAAFVWGQDPTPWCLIAELAMSALALVVAVLILRRGRAEREPSVTTTTAALPTVVLGAVVTTSVPITAWGPSSCMAVGVGAVLAAWAFLTLSTSFAILPARRTTVTAGPYRVIRHPGYAGELLMLFGCVVASEQFAVAALWVIALALIHPRMRAEELTMGECPRYRAYLSATRYRLVPGVY